MRVSRGGAFDLPTYQSTIESAAGVTGRSPTLEHAAGILQDLGKELDKSKVGSPDKPIACSLVDPLGAGAAQVQVIGRTGTFFACPRNKARSW
jgi:hypothetical protein